MTVVLGTSSTFTLSLCSNLRSECSARAWRGNVAIYLVPHNTYVGLRPLSLFQGVIQKEG